MAWDRVLDVATFLAAIGSGLIAGVFFAFSTFVMRALGRRPPTEGMAAMQAINVAVIRCSWAPSSARPALAPWRRRGR